jgi:hypothetical protein
MLMCNSMTRSAGYHGSRSVAGSRRARGRALLLGVAALMAATAHALAYFSITASPSSVCVGDAITVTVETDCGIPELTDTVYVGGPDLTELTPWTYNSDAGVWYWQGTFTTTLTYSGNYLGWSAYDDCAEWQSTDNVAVVAASMVQMSPNYADNWVGNTIGFQCVLVPSGATSPRGVTWSGLGPGGSGTGSGNTVSTSYASTGPQTATATVGISSANKSVTIHSLSTSANADCPAPKSRTALGIGEMTFLAVDPSATCVWSLSEGSSSSISSSSGASAMFTASWSSETVTVVCHLGDAGGPQPSTPIVYNIVAPSGMAYLADLGKDEPFASYTRGIYFFGTRHGFKTQYMPNSVSFARLAACERLREHVPYQNHLFPDTDFSLTTLAADVVPSIADCSYGINISQDVFGMGAKMSTEALGDPATADSCTVNCPLQYKNAEGTWVTFDSSNIHVYNWSEAFVSTLTGTDSAGSQSSSADGPWDY